MLYRSIINSYADGTFRPAGTVTGYQFMKMLLGALGYNGKVEGFTGDNWTVNVAKLSVALGLDKGNDTFVGSKAMTREEACLYAFNTLKNIMVDYENLGTEIVVGGTTITVGASKAAQEKNNSSTDGNIKEDGLMQFAEKYFTKLTLDEASSVVDSFGRPAHSWKNDKTKVGTYADAPVVSYTTGVKGTVLADDIDDAGYEAGAVDVKIYRNGNTVSQTMSAADVKAALKSANKLGGNGVVVELYADSDDNINRAVVIVNYLA